MKTKIAKYIVYPPHTVLTGIDRVEVAIYVDGEFKGVHMYECELGEPIPTQGIIDLDIECFPYDGEGKDVIATMDGNPPVKNKDKPDGLAGEVYYVTEPEVTKTDYQKACMVSLKGRNLDQQIWLKEDEKDFMVMSERFRVNAHDKNYDKKKNIIKEEIVKNILDLVKESIRIYENKDGFKYEAYGVLRPEDIGKRSQIKRKEK